MRGRAGRVQCDCRACLSPPAPNLFRPGRRQLLNRAGRFSDDLARVRTYLSYSRREGLSHLPRGVACLLTPLLDLLLHYDREVRRLIDSLCTRRQFTRFSPVQAV